MSHTIFESDEVLLFQISALPHDKIWYNILVKNVDDLYELWVMEWNPQDNSSKESRLNCFEFKEEAKRASLELARCMNKLPDLDVIELQMASA